MSAFKSKEDQDYSRDLFGGYYKKNFDVLSGPNEQTSRFGQLKVLRTDGTSADRSTDDIGSTSTNSIPYSPRRSTPTHKKSFELSFDSPNPSLAAINQKTSAAALQHSLNTNNNNNSTSTGTSNISTNNNTNGNGNAGAHLYSNGTSNGNQPLWLNNPKTRFAPSRAIKRETIDDIEPESNFLTKTNSNQNSSTSSGFKTLTFGTRRNNTELTHMNAFADELPPSKTISDLQREDDSESFLSFQSTQVNTNQVGSLMSPRAPNDLLTNGTPSIKHLQRSGGLSSASSAFSTPLKLGNSSEQTQQQQQQQQQQHANPAPSLRTTGGESAVLVFGYPESMANQVIKHFGKFGNILEDFEATRADPLFHHHHQQQEEHTQRSFPIFTGDSWVKLTYDNRASAIRALEESGAVFHGSMIGCVPYSKSAIENIASIDIPVNEDIGESDIPMQQTNGIQRDDNTNSNDVLKYASAHPQKLTLKTDEKIFMKSKKDSTSLYHGGANLNKDTQPVNDSLLGKVSNWFFGWEDL